MRAPMVSKRMGVGLVGLAIVTALVAGGCSGGGGGSSEVVTEQADLEATVAVAEAQQAAEAALGGTTPLTFSLTAADVTAITKAAAEAIASTTIVIAVTDREGTVLGVYRGTAAPATVAGNFGATVNANDFAVALARTGAFFSNDQAPLSSRTVRFISGIHFPPGIANKPNAALYGIENTNRGCPLVAPGEAFDLATPLARSTSIAGGTCDFSDASGCGLGIATGKADLNDSDPNAVAPGGVPIYKNGRVAGGIGVAGVGPALAEFAAFTGSTAGAGFGPKPAEPGVINLDGIQLPFVNNTTAPAGAGTGTFDGTFVSGPIDSPRGEAGVPQGFLINPIASAQLSASEVNTIVAQAVAQADKTRAAIRLPTNTPAKMVIAVSDLTGRIIGLFRMPDATVFSIDVAVSKARNVVYFSSAALVPTDLPGVPVGTAVTNRTISFGAQPLFPPGIDGSGPGPFFTLYTNDVATPCRQGSEPANVHQSGIVFFPGSMPLYRNGVLIGGLGVSGDGVEQDDLVTAAGATGFAPPQAIRADEILINGIRLPFVKFPPNPELQ